MPKALQPKDWSKPWPVYAPPKPRVKRKKIQAAQLAPPEPPELPAGQPTKKPGRKRETAERNAAIVEAVKNGTMTRKEAATRFCLSYETVCNITLTAGLRGVRGGSKKGVRHKKPAYRVESRKQRIHDLVDAEFREEQPRDVRMNGALPAGHVLTWGPISLGMVWPGSTG